MVIFSSSPLNKKGEKGGAQLSSRIQEQCKKMWKIQGELAKRLGGGIGMSTITKENLNTPGR